MTLKLKKWNILDHFKTNEDMRLYLQACIEEAGNDSQFIVKALGDIAKARSMPQLNPVTSLEVDRLSQDLSVEENPSFATIWQIIQDLGLKLHVETVAKTSAT